MSEHNFTLRMRADQLETGDMFVVAEGVGEFIEWMSRTPDERGRVRFKAKFSPFGRDPEGISEHTAQPDLMFDVQRKEQ